MIEVWKNVTCHSKEIWVSNLGNIRDQDLKEIHQNKSGRYNRFSIGKHREMTHIWVALVFCQNPALKPFVHHINGNKRDNRACNLMWCTPEEHNEFHGSNKSVDQLSDKEDVLATFPSIKAASRAVGAKQHTAISLCCSGKRKSAYGYRWRYSVKREKCNTVTP